ncbi:MAG: TrbC/VirB2 family protein [Patescibacteria group bacterium]
MDIKRARITSAFVLLGASLLFYMTSTVEAQDNFLDLFSDGQDEEGGVLTILENLTKTIRTVMLPLLTLVVFWAGYTMASARGNETEYTKGKKILLQALIGTAIISVAPLLVQIAREFKNALP